MSGAMRIRGVSLEEWGDLFPAPAFIYDSQAFLSLNERKCERLVLLAASDGKAGFGIASGLRGDTLHAPFSAPFCTIETTGNPGLELRLQFAIALRDYCRENGLGLELTLPPGCHPQEEDAINRAVMVQVGFRSMREDLNYHLPLHPAPEMTPTARNKTSRARRESLMFEECRLDSLEEIYDTIRRNREMKGFPLRMTPSDLKETAPVAGARLFALRRREGRIAAAAVVYRCSVEAYHLIYWGHTDPTPGVMNLLASELTGALGEDSQAAILDLGPASDRGILLPGLARFKQSLGALPTVKPTFQF